MRRVLPVIVVVAALAGCQSSSDRPEAGVVSAGTPGPFEVRVGADGSLLAGATSADERSSDALVERVRALTADGRHTTARLMVERYPEAALRALRQTRDSEVLSIIALAYGDGSEWLAWRGSRPAEFAAYDAERAQVRQALRSGRFADAAAIDLVPPQAAGPFAAVEAHELRGTALLLANRPAEAAVEFAQAVEAARDKPPHQEAKLRLLGVEASRRAGLVEHASTAWQEVQAALPPVAWTPEVLELLLSTRPADLDWPTGGSFDNEAIVGLEIATRHLDRDEPRDALATATRAAELAAAEDTHGRLRLVQAEALAQLDQPGAAATILTRLTTSASSAVAAEATAKLGSFELQRGRPAAGTRLLRRALDSDDLDADARASAEADLALALLATGRHEQGVAALHAAQQRFAAAGETEQLIRSLRNEHRFYTATKRNGDAEAVSARLDQLEATHDGPNSPTH